jgi:pre-60S factor REI1
MSESEVNEIIDKRIAEAVRLDELDCLFCTHKAATFEDNMTHMTKVHSFFIPDIEYLADLSGLIKYLGEKISVGNTCLYCNGKGRAIKSLEAVRAHMVKQTVCD